MPDQSQTEGPRLEIVSGPGSGGRIPLFDQRPVTIGRGGRSDVTLDDRSVSTEHCRVSRSGPVTLLVDLGSRNGCLVNGAPVARRELADGDRVTIGSVELVYRAASASAGKEPTTVLTVLLPSRQPDRPAFTPDAPPGEGVRRVPDHEALDLLFRTGNLANTDRPMQEVLPEVLEAIRRVLRADRALFAWEEGAGEGTIAVGDGRPGETPVLARSVREAIQAGRTVVVQFDSTTSNPWGESRTLARQGVAALVCVPVIVGAELAGALYADVLQGGRSFDPRTAQVLSAIGDMLATGIARERKAREALELERTLRERENLAAIGLMTSAIVHDLKNVLQCLTGYVQLSEVDDEAKAELPQNVTRYCKKAETTIESILATARRSEAQRTRFDLVPLVRDVDVLLTGKLRKAGIALTIEAGTAPAVVDGHAGQIQDAVLNLCLNAIQAMPDGGRLGIAVQAAGDRLRLSISDTGRGSPEELRQRLFRPFASTRKAGQGGTGLGLFRVRKIVEEHGGRVEVASAPGAGTTFTLDLPSATTP